MQKYSSGQKYKVIALCVACFGEEEESRYIRNFCRRAAEHNCKIVVFSSEANLYFNGSDDKGEAAIFDLIEPERFDAVILMAETYKRNDEQYAMVDRARAAKVPVILIDRLLKGCYGITFDYGDSFQEVVKHMIEYHGYRRVNFLAGVKGNSFSEERLNAFKEVLAENGIEYDPRRVAYGDFWDLPAKAAVEEFLDSDLEPPEAIICANDAMAMAVCSKLKERGIRIPEDIAVSGFDGMEMIEYYPPRITTAAYDREKMYNMVFDMLENGFEPYTERNVIRNVVKIGHSCGCNECGLIDAGEQILMFRNQLGVENKYHQLLNIMTCELNGEGASKVFTKAKEYLDLIDYRQFFVCFNEDVWNKLMEEDCISTGRDKDGEGPFSRRLNLLHYEYKGSMDTGKTLALGELLPELDEVFEREDYIMVTPFHIRERVLGYYAVSFDCDNFRFGAYSAFCYNLKAMCENMLNRLDMSRVYLTDLITGLYNRNGFYNRIERILKEESCGELGIISLDMDNLKRINDSFGHSEGDAALHTLAQLILDAGGRTELCARIGGDEFLIALRGKDTRVRAGLLAESIRKRLESYNAQAFLPYQINASIGISGGDIKGHDLDYFLNQADKAMYAEKRKHKNTRNNSK